MARTGKRHLLASPGRKVGRGLKQPVRACYSATMSRIARPQGRAWIETSSGSLSPMRPWRIARPQGRAWIETIDCATGDHALIASPGRKVGRGLKQS
jgi:hypothetical protein